MNEQKTKEQTEGKTSGSGKCEDKNSGSGKREHIGLKLAKVLFPLLGAALCLAGVIQGAYLHVRFMCEILFLVACLCLGVASWLFLGSELGRYYFKKSTESERPTVAEDSPGKEQSPQDDKLPTLLIGYEKDLTKRNRFGWALVLLGVICFVFAILVGGEKINFILFSWLLG